MSARLPLPLRVPKVDGCPLQILLRRPLHCGRHLVPWSEDFHASKLSWIQRLPEYRISIWSKAFSLLSHGFPALNNDGAPTTTFPRVLALASIRHGTGTPRSCLSDSLYDIGLFMSWAQRSSFYQSFIAPLPLRSSILSRSVIFSIVQMHRLYMDAKRPKRVRKAYTRC